MRRRGRAVLGVLALLLAGCGGGGGTRTGTSVVDGAPFACPDPTSVAASAGEASLPTGATGALICYRDNHDLWFAPAGALTEHVGRLVRLVNAQPLERSEPREVCAADLGPAYDLVVRYADGTRIVRGEYAGCRDLVVGPAQRAGGRLVFRAFLSATAAQRRHTRPPVARQAPPACPTSRIPPYSPLADPTRLAAASLCTHLDDRWNGERPGRPLTSRRLAALRHDLATARARVFEPRRRQHLCRSPVLRGPLRISALDAWGDRFVVDLACDTYRFVPRGGPGLVTVHLLPRTARVLARG